MAPGAGKKDATVTGGDTGLLFHAPQEGAEHLGLASIVTAVIAPENRAAVGGNDYALDGRGTNVQSNQE